MAKPQQPTDPEAEVARLWEMVARTKQMYRHAVKRDHAALLRFELQVLGKLWKLIERGGKRGRG